MYEISKEEFETLLHFAYIGQNHVVIRNNHGDREVARELDDIIHIIKERGFI